MRRPALQVKWQRVLARDEPCRSVEGEVVPRPLQEHEEPVLEFDNVHKMNEQPHQPGRETRKADPAQVRHGGRPADGRHGSLIEVMERPRALAADPSLDDFGHVAALLYSWLCDSRQRLATLMAEVGEVADHKDLGTTRQAEVGLD